MLIPADDHDVRLIENVHPSNYLQPVPADRYHLVVLGGGSAGLVCAAAAAGLGAKVALVEKSLMGGDCLNFGCVPSKALIAVSKSWHKTSDFAEAMRRVRQLRAEISPDDSVDRFKRLGVDIFLGKGRFLDAHSLGINGLRVRFRKAVIATGTRPRIPEVAGLKEAGFLTNETIFQIKALPKRLAILGGGPVGCELGQAFQRMGAEVSILQRGNRLLPHEDPEASGVLYQQLIKDGVMVRLGCLLEQVGISGNSRRLLFRTEGRTERLEVEEILVAAGREANIHEIGLAEAGVESSEEGIVVNDFLQTSNPDIYAAGDVCLKQKFTHAADAAARIVVQNALFAGRKRMSRVVVPWCTYTSPEIAGVGRMTGTIFQKNLSEVHRARLEGEVDGFIKICVAEKGDKILGATIVAPHAGEMINEITLAMQQGIGLSKLSGVVHPYPSYSEAIRQVGDAYQRTKLTPGIKKILEGWFKWVR
ncbi:MAG: mercuric reductase [Verrucomicrobiota bacterium]|nr:mercuric reductase [Verrucomicrobiota bacterium]